MEVKRIIEDEGYMVGNIDSTVIAEKPKLAKYIPAMKEKLPVFWISCLVI